MAAETVAIDRLPKGCVQPQSVVDDAGTVHVVYLKGEGQGQDIEYMYRKAGEAKFSPAVQVNSIAASAVATGTIRGAQVAVSKDGTVHVLWNGTMASAQVPGGGSPLFYTRLSAGKFEQQRNLMTKTFMLDGGGSIAAGPGGAVYVAWHASKSSQPGKETDRGVYLATSLDNGKTFSAEREVNPPKSGACACCGLRIQVDEKGEVNLLFRAAFTALDRDILWLRSADQGKTFQVVNRDAWKIGQCPMSSAWLRDGWAAWEADGKVKFSRMDGGLTYSPAGDVKRKHPVAVQSKDGKALLIWTEGTGWKKGGSVVWLELGADGKPLGPVQRRDDLPVWGLATAWAGAKGGWGMLY
ncbi:MAG TPA: sialidase family protein [Verrucomicrobiae bacterium]